MKGSATVLESRPATSSPATGYWPRRSPASGAASPSGRWCRPRWCAFPTAATPGSRCSGSSSAPWSSPCGASGQPDLTASLVVLLPSAERGRLVSCSSAGPPSRVHEDHRVRPDRVKAGPGGAVRRDHDRPRARPVARRSGAGRDLRSRADLVIEAVGLDRTRIECLDAVRPEGRVGYFGFPETLSTESTWSFSRAWAKRASIEVVTGAQLEPGLASFHEAVRLIASGAVDTAPLAADVYPLASIQDAFESARERQGPKTSVELRPGP